MEWSKARASDLQAACRDLFAFARIGSDNEKVRRRRKALVPGPSGQDRNVSGRQMEASAADAAEKDLRGAPGNSERLVNLRVVVWEGIHAVAPRSSPAVPAKQFLDSRGAVELDRESRAAR